MTGIGVVEDDGTVRPKRGRGRPSGEEFDPWSTESVEKYRDDRIYSRSANDYDHSGRLEFKVPPGIKAQVVEVVEKVPGYRNLWDFTRDAVVHRLKWWMDQGLDLPEEMLRQLERELWMCEAERVEGEMRLMESIVSKHREVMHHAEETGNFGVVGMELQAVEAQIEEVDEPYCGQLRKLAQEYRGKMKRVSE